MKSDNPLQRFIEPIPRPKQKMIFVPGKGMIPDPNDIDAGMLYDLNEAVDDSEAESQRQKSFANVGYANLKRRG